MNCLTARETLDLARPHDGGPHKTGGDESQGATIDEAARHVESCPACQTVVRRREQIDARIGQLSRDVPVPAGLRERLLARLSNEIVSGSHAGVKPVVRSRRRLMFSAVAAGVVAVLGVFAWRLMLPRAPSLSLDDIAGYALLEDIKPDDLRELTQFKGGLPLQSPKTMRTLPRMQPFRRLDDPQLGDREIAVYFFTLSRQGGKFKGRLVVVPAAAIKDAPTASSFPGQTLYRLGFCTTAWVEGKFVYLCCVRGGEDELHLLRPARADPA